MTHFTGYGPGKKDSGSTRKRAAGRRGPSIATRFSPFISPQIDRKTARKLGLERVQGGTAFKTERELNRYLEHERRAGREIHWKQHGPGE